MFYHSLILSLTAQNHRWADRPGQLCIFQSNGNWESPQPHFIWESMWNEGWVQFTTNCFCSTNWGGPRPLLYVCPLQVLGILACHTGPQVFMASVWFDWLVSELEILLKSSTGVIFLICCPLPYKCRHLLRMHPGLAFHSFFPACPPQTAQVLAEANSIVALWVSAPFHMLFPVSDGLLAFPNVASQEGLLSLPFHMLLPSPCELSSLCCLCHGTDF